MHRVHLNELNRTRPHLNKRRIGSRSISSSLCFPSPPLGVTVHAVRRHVFPSLPVFPYFSEFPLSPRNGSTHPRIRIGFREESTFFPPCYLTTCRWFVTAKPIFSNVLLLLKRWKMIERRRERKNCENICKFFIETRDSDFDLEDFHVGERDKWESNLVILIRNQGEIYRLCNLWRKMNDVAFVSIFIEPKFESMFPLPNHSLNLMISKQWKAICFLILRANE